MKVGGPKSFAIKTFFSILDFLLSCDKISVSIVSSKIIKFYCFCYESRNFLFSFFVWLSLF